MGEQSRGQSTGDTDDGAKESGLSTPGGGPQRVVSSKSVDDILESLESTTTRRTTPDPATQTSETPLPERVPDRPTAVTDRQTTGGDRHTTASDRPDADTGRPDPAIELAERVDSGTVTGADVRAAETGRGREPTPDVGELDRSLEDLDSTDASSETTSDESKSDQQDDDTGGLFARARARLTRVGRRSRK